MWCVWWRGEGCTGFWWGNLRERDHLEDPGILRWILRKWDGRGMDWIDLAQERDRCQALVDMEMNLQVP